MLTLIAEESGRSRERVRQIAQKLHYQTAMETVKKEKIAKCWYCEKMFTKEHGRQKFCSSECRVKYNSYKYYTLDICRECGFGFINPRAKGLRHKFYCSKTCQGKYAARNWGWTIQVKGVLPRYGNKERVIKDFGDEPFTTMEFARKYGYLNLVSANISIKNLILRGVVEVYKIKGMYRINEKPAVAKSN
jgi:hypothetical protein